jgi:hypothetical protein
VWKRQNWSFSLSGVAEGHDDDRPPVPAALLSARVWQRSASRPEANSPNSEPRTRTAPPLFSPWPNAECQRQTGGLPSSPGETTGSANLSDQLSRSKGVILTLAFYQWLIPGGAHGTLDDCGHHDLPPALIRALRYRRSEEASHR